jgi:hypothetical protein
MFTLCIVLIMLFCWLSTRPQKPIVRIQRHPRHWRLP